jgi:hypothetical protein
LGSCGSGQEPVATSCEHDYELSGSVKGTEGFGQLSYCQFLKYESVLGSWLNVDGLNKNCVLCSPIYKLFRAMNVSDTPIAEYCSQVNITVASYLRGPGFKSWLGDRVS